MKNNKTHKQKSIEEYRRDIHTLKIKLKSQEEYVTELRQKYANSEVLSDKTYTFSMKLKILEYTLNDIRAKLSKFADDEAYQYYRLNYATFTLVKSCQIIGFTKQMIFRGVDNDGKNEVGWFQLSNFLKEVMRLDTEFINPIMNALTQDESKPITKQRYQFFLSSFMIKSQQNGHQIDNLDGSTMRISGEMIKQNIQPESLWDQKQINIAICVYSLMTKVKFLDVLDCVGCYCKCDPLKNGVINSSAVVTMLKQRINDSINFNKGNKFKLYKS